MNLNVISTLFRRLIIVIHAFCHFFVSYCLFIWFQSIKVVPLVCDPLGFMFFSYYASVRIIWTNFVDSVQS